MRILRSLWCPTCRRIGGRHWPADGTGTGGRTFRNGDTQDWRAMQCAITQVAAPRKARR